MIIEVKKKKYIITEKKSLLMCHLKTFYIFPGGIYSTFGKNPTTVSYCNTFRNREVITKASHLSLEFLPSFHCRRP